MITTFWKGDKAEYTGKAEYHYGSKWFEIRMLEGHLKGVLRFVSEAQHEHDTASIPKGYLGCKEVQE